MSLDEPAANTVAVANVHIPKLGMEMMDATVAEWLVGDGDYCEMGSVIAVLDTDKLTHDVEAPSSGYLRIVRGEGTLCPVGDVIAVIAETEEHLQQVLEPPSDESQEAPAPETSSDSDAPARPAAVGRLQASPAARAKARVHDLDLAAVAGTGPRGLITADDVDAALGASTRAEGDASTRLAGRTVRIRVPLSGMRRVIAERMMASLQTSAQVTSWFSIDASALVEYRYQFQEGARSTYLAIITAAVGRTLRKHPVLNASIDGDTVLIWDCVNVGVAVAVTQPGELPDGLVVPVLRDADRKPLGLLNEELSSKVREARGGTLAVDDMSGGTFTVSSVGNVKGVAWEGSTPVLNGDESGILWTGAIRETAVVRGGQVVPGLTLPVALTHDHRLVDGVAAARFLADLTTLLQSAERLGDLQNNVPVGEE